MGLAGGTGGFSLSEQYATARACKAWGFAPPDFINSGFPENFLQSRAARLMDILPTCFAPTPGLAVVGFAFGTRARRGEGRACHVAGQGGQAPGSWLYGREAKPRSKAS